MYFIDKKTRKLVITIIYINDVCFISSKKFPTSLRVEVRIHNEIKMSWSWKNQRVSWNMHKSQSQGLKDLCRPIWVLEQSSSIL